MAKYMILGAGGQLADAFQMILAGMSDQEVVPLTKGDFELGRADIMPLLEFH